MDKLPVSVVINTFNEEKNIKNCLETVKWAEEIIIVDMYSDDKTVDIARDYTDKIFFFERMGYADPAREYALSKATKNWVLIVDADELVPVKLYRRLKEIIENDLADVVMIPRNNYFFGTLLKGTGWGPLQDMLPRFFKRGYMELSPAVHSIFRIEPSARILKIENPEEGFMHFNYIDVEHFIEKLNRYTTIEAKNMFDGIKPNYGFMNLLLRLTKEFVRRFFYKKGYTDGINGFGLTVLMLAYHTTSFLKYRLMKKYATINPREEILRKYQGIAQEVIAEYKDERS